MGGGKRSRADSEHGAHRRAAPLTLPPPPGPRRKMYGACMAASRRRMPMRHRVRGKVHAQKEKWIRRLRFDAIRWGGVRRRFTQ